MSERVSIWIICWICFEEGRRTVLSAGPGVKKSMRNQLLHLSRSGSNDYYNEFGKSFVYTAFDLPNSSFVITYMKRKGIVK